MHHKIARLSMLTPQPQQSFDELVAFADALPPMPAAEPAPRREALCLRPDEPRPGLDTQTVLMNAAHTDGPYIAVPKTVE